MHEELNANPEPVHEMPKASAESPTESSKGGAGLRQPRVRLSAVVALAVAAGLIAWAATNRGGNSPSTANPTAGPRTKGTGPVALSPRGLRTLSRALGQPIYWAGQESGYTYEVTQVSKGKIFVRYLPQGVKVGAKGASYLIVATYSFPKAFNALKAVSKGHEIAIPGNGIAAVDQGYPKSVHLAFPRVNYQVEVYDPSPARARNVATSGDVRPVR